MRAVGVHHPEGCLPLVVHLVDPAARVDDLRAVGGKLRRLDVHPVEILLEGEFALCVRLRLRRPRAGGGDEQQGAEHGANVKTHGHSEGCVVEGKSWWKWGGGARGRIPHSSSAFCIGSKSRIPSPLTSHLSLSPERRLPPAKPHPEPRSEERR